MDHPEIVVANLIAKYKDTPFSYGHFDCYTFAWDFLREAKGVDFMPHWYENYHDQGRLLNKKQLMETFEFDSLRSAISHRYQEKSKLFCGRWDLVACPPLAASPFEIALGVSVGHSALVVSTVGLGHVPIETIVCGWDIQCL
jgi:hypothetical protein